MQVKWHDVHDNNVTSKEEMQQAHSPSLFAMYYSDATWRNIATATDTAAMGGLGAMDGNAATVEGNDNMGTRSTDNSWMDNRWEGSLFGMTHDFIFSQPVQAQPTTTETVATTIYQQRLSDIATVSSSALSPQTPMIDAQTLSPTISTSDSLKESPLLFSKESVPSGALSCPCLKTLTAHLCHLNNLEHQSQGQIQIDTALRETDGTLACVQGVLNCDSCHPDSTVLLLLAKVLQTVMNWIQIEYQQQQRQHQPKCNNRDLKNTIPRCSFPQDTLIDGPQAPTLPPPATVVQVGTWKVPEADQVLVKNILTSRVLASSSSVLVTMRLRADKMALEVAASAHSPVYHALNVEPVQQMLQRLAVTMQELGQHVKLEFQSWR